MVTLDAAHKKYIYISVMAVVLVCYTIYMTTSNLAELKLKTLDNFILSESNTSGKFSTQACTTTEGTRGDISLVTETPTQGGFGEKSTTKISEIGSTFLDLEKTLCAKNFTDETEGKSKKPCPTKGIVSIHQGGRLANQIWEFAAMWAVAKETGLEAYAPRCIYNAISKVFKALPCTNMEEISHCPVDLKNFSESLHHWNRSTQGIVFRKFIFEPLLVAKWYKDISSEYLLRDELVEKNTKVLLEAQKKSPSNTFVGIHVRRTDFAKFIKESYNGTVPGKDFFLKAMDYYDTKFKNVTFVLASDDRKWCEENLGNKKNLFIAPPATPEEDLALMSMCNHSIFDFGTYGAWGAMYSGGETIFYNVPKYSLPRSIAKSIPEWRSL